MTIKSTKHFSLIITLILFFAVRGWAFEVPSLTGPVMDQARILNSSIAQQLDQVLRSVNQSGVLQLQVLTLNSL
ncbi:MAG: methanol dehydrogenase, partial [Bdellovibrionales bacterium]